MQNEAAQSATLPLSHTTRVATIDAKLEPFLSQYIWRIGSHGYPVATVEGEAVLLHTLVMKLSERFVAYEVGGHVVVEHLNEDKLDARTANLSQTSQSVNMFRSKGIYVKTQRDSRGYTYYPLCMRWNYAYITIVTTKEKIAAEKLKPFVKALILTYVEANPFVGKADLLKFIQANRKEIYNELNV